MPDIIVDAGPLVALFRPSDRFHATARAFVARSESDHLISNLLVFGEMAALLGAHHHELVTAIEWVVANVEIDDGVVADMPRTIEVLQKYHDLPADLADASLVALCERRQTNLVASIDKDFDVYRLFNRRRFENVFFSELD